MQRRQQQEQRKKRFFYLNKPIRNTTSNSSNANKQKTYENNVFGQYWQDQESNEVPPGRSSPLSGHDSRWRPA